MGTDKGIAGAGQLRNQRGKTVPDIARCLTFDLSAVAPNEFESKF